VVDYSRTIVVHAGAGESGFLLPNQSASPSFVSARGPAGATARPVNCRVCGGRWFAWLSPPPGRVVPHSRVCESVRVCSGHGALRLPRVVRPVHGAACHRRVACHLCRRCRVLSPPPAAPAVAPGAVAGSGRCRPRAPCSVPCSVCRTPCELARPPRGAGAYRCSACKRKARVGARRVPCSVCRKPCELARPPRGAGAYRCSACKRKARVGARRVPCRVTCSVCQEPCELARPPRGAGAYRCSACTQEARVGARGVTRTVPCSVCQEPCELARPPRGAGARPYHCADCRAAAAVAKGTSAHGGARWRPVCCCCCVVTTRGGRAAAAMHHAPPLRCRRRRATLRAAAARGRAPPPCCCYAMLGATILQHAVLLCGCYLLLRCVMRLRAACVRCAVR
jgi:hypothetical protein